MSIDLSQFLPSFLEESDEGLALMESGLLDLEPGDDESINAIFRAAHSIKGGAGTFGFNQVTDFTHLVETLLDEMRDGRRQIVGADIEILLKSVDCIRLLIEAEKVGETCEDTRIGRTTDLLNQTLALSETASEQINEQTPLESTAAEGSSQTSWQIEFIPEHHLVQTGNDPIFLLNALADLGDVSIRCQSQLPAFDELDPEELFLTWQIELVADVEEDEIREIFEWVEDECQLNITKVEAVEQTLVAPEHPTPELVEAPAAQAEPEPVAVPEAPIEPISALAASTPVTSDKANKPAAKATVKAKPDAGSIRVGVDKVDSLINLVGELVITQSMLSELGNNFDLTKVERLNAGLEQLLQNTKELQESVMRIRMLPISFAFNRFPRLVHDLSLKTGKQVDLVINGEQTELDKTVMEQIGDPLVHLVRNAVDHGIEASEQRIANGKPAQGTITLDAYHQGGNIVIEISDDGGGINRDAVLNKAIEKGVVEPGVTLNDSQVFDLLFEPGFSTAKQVSDISGRGVGMDVVKRNIQALGGRIQVESEPGQGSTFRVYLPLTLAILDGQLVKVGDQVYVIPLISIVESLQAKAELINTVSGDLVLYRLREDNVPVLPVYQLFNLPADNKDVEGCLLVVVEADGQKVGLMVDDLLAQQQVVIKSLEDNYQQVDGISGATILGDGSVAMIIDIPGIIDMALSHARDKQDQFYQSMTQEHV